jgi:N-acetylmuramoyl-L-alanine amidase
MSQWVRFSFAVLALVVGLGLVVSAWKVVPKDWREFKGVFGSPTCEPRGILVHHTATPDSIGGDPVNVAVLDSIHSARGYGTIFAWRIYHVGYHYLILPDGTVERGRPDTCQGAHGGTLAQNRSYLGVALVGDFSGLDPRGRSRPSASQVTSLETLLRALMTRFNIPVAEVRRHSDVRPGTLCPGAGLDLDAILAQLSLR